MLQYFSIVQYILIKINTLGNIFFLAFHFPCFFFFHFPFPRCTHTVFVITTLTHGGPSIHALYNTAAEMRAFSFDLTHLLIHHDRWFVHIFLSFILNPQVGFRQIQLYILHLYGYSIIVIENALWCREHFPFFFFF